MTRLGLFLCANSQNGNNKHIKEYLGLQTSVNYKIDDIANV